jgi:NitT/TauT family transport system substrate-binding protein
VWQKFAGSGRLPNLGVAAHQEWITGHRDLIPRLYRAYAAAADWITANPAAAAKLISLSQDPSDLKSIEQMIREKTRLALDVTPAANMRREIEATYRMGVEVGLFKTLPDDAAIYDQDLH